MTSLDDLPEALVQGLTRAVIDVPLPTETSQHMLEQGSVKAEVPRTQSGLPTFYGSVSVDEALEIYRVVRAVEPNTTVEIGLCCGASAIAILKALADSGQGTHHACDPFQARFGNQGLFNIEMCGLTDRFRFHEALPESIVPSLPRVQFAFVDGSHLFDLSLLDFVLIDKRLEIGGLIGFHDLWMPSLQKLIRYMTTNRGYEIVTPHRSREGLKLRRILRNAISGVARAVPSGERVFAPEFLHPWHTITSSDSALMFLRKTRSDDRDFRFHRKF